MFVQEAEEARAREKAEAAQKSGETSGPGGEQPHEEVPMETLSSGAGAPPSGGQSDPSVNIQPIPYVVLLSIFIHIKLRGKSQYF